MNGTFKAQVRYRVNLTVGRGAWSFTRDVDLSAMPVVGMCVAAGEDEQVYEVASVTITPQTVYVRCHYTFQSQKGAEAAGMAWDGGS